MRLDMSKLDAALSLVPRSPADVSVSSVASEQAEDANGIPIGTNQRQSSEFRVANNSAMTL